MIQTTDATEAAEALTPAIQAFLLTVMAAEMEDAQSSDEYEGWGCSLILKIGGAYVVRTEPVWDAAAGRWGQERPHFEYYATEQEGWDRYNALCALDWNVSIDGLKERWAPRERAHFEYHCWENSDSADAPLWHRSHQVVTVLGEDDGSDAYGVESTLAQREEWCTPRLYRVRFPDGLEGSVFEDELLTGPEWFQRPAPPLTLGV